MTVFLTLLALASRSAIAARGTLFSSQRVRRMRWRIMVRLRPGPGFATLAELTVRWSRLAALHHGRRARPSMRLHHRITVPHHRLRDPARPRPVLPPRLRPRRGPDPHLVAAPVRESPGCWGTG